MALLNSGDTPYLYSQDTAQADRDFHQAVTKGRWHKLMSWVRGEDYALLSLQEYLEGYSLNDVKDSGLQVVDIHAIKGSLNRSLDFDNTFMPIQDHTQDRWIYVDKAYHDDKSLLPVTLWQINDIYFVQDGHHRISVARLHGQLFIDAYVKTVFVDRCCAIY